MHEVPDAVQEPAGRDQVAAELRVDRQCDPAEEHRAAGLDAEAGPPVRCPPGQVSALKGELARPSGGVGPAVLRRALAAGVRGFVPKTTSAARPAEIIRDIAAGRRYVDPDIAASALTEDDCALTDRELEVLRAARTGASIAEIVGEVHLTPGTVRNHLSAAMSKLGAPTRHAAAHRAWEQGWI
ncbi:response regulator transcription factor [Streptomyces chartreusis]